MLLQLLLLLPVLQKQQLCQEIARRDRPIATAVVNANNTANRVANIAAGGPQARVQQQRLGQLRIIGAAEAEAAFPLACIGSEAGGGGGGIGPRRATSRGSGIPYI
ncbi:hypothetical protein VOLCADRAFT_93898 [Volvox carteri f. nagariensis]|uniref:Secreted protein n=1 Tax=Volvox carteri f. nagariensis TaxID=3068 RepID=D8U3D0_VOLCA|nr:uncharacterized protein VOLCADRAFT_93898 [Volvox carteri f. nagariensis]EFJ45805.1 hypothetical protein VOLCADRAFT_93898 [Volvox carteri f. nagariensis]|eukprot:XP_002953206.1 hypothetical protein VOLCADRAFT_93898 [Volvox carteri f. nagariensis]